MGEVKTLSPEWFAEEAKTADIDLSAINETQKWFEEKYSIERLKALQGQEVLTSLFGNEQGEKNYLCYDLERNKAMKVFGGIAGGSAYKFGLFYSSEGCWKTGCSQKPVVLSEEEAVDLATRMRDELIGGAEEIANSPVPQSKEDYITLYRKVRGHIELNLIWKLKYYRMLFPELFFTGYADDVQRQYLYTLQIEPHENKEDPDEGTFVRMGQIALFARKCGLSCVVFGIVFAQHFGWQTLIYRIGTGNGDTNFTPEWVEHGYCAIGWDELGDLTAYLDETEGLSKEKLTTALLEKCPTYDKKTASKKAGEIIGFYSAGTEGCYVAAMKDQSIYAIGKLTGKYSYDPDAVKYRHHRAVEWIFKAAEPVDMPVTEGKLTTFVKITKPENLMLLHRLIFRGEQPNRYPLRKMNGGLRRRNTTRV